MNPLTRRLLSELERGPVSRTDLQEGLETSGDDLQAAIDTLEEKGFDIAERPAGLTVAEPPEYGGLAVEYGLDAPYTIEFHETIESTNARARELAGEEAADVVILADEQTGGRGRLERDWESPSGGVWLSILIRPGGPPAEAPIYTMAAAVATANAARQAGVEATIKWPNDVQVDGAKLAGILTEMGSAGEEIDWVAVGIGLNCNVDLAEVPEHATSIQAVAGTVDRRVVTQVLLEEFHELSADLDSVLPAWRTLTDTLGQRVRVSVNEDEITGQALDVDFPGTLRIDTGGAIKTITAGDCEHLRPV